MDDAGPPRPRRPLRHLTETRDRALAEAELINRIAGTAAGQVDLHRILSTTLNHLRAEATHNSIEGKRRCGRPPG